MKKFYSLVIIFTAVIIFVCGFNITALQDTKAENINSGNIENIENYSSCCTFSNNELLLINTPLR